MIMKNNVFDNDINFRLAIKFQFNYSLREFICFAQNNTGTN